MRCELLPAEVDIVVQCAQAAWETLYGAPRVHSTMKAHGNTGKKRDAKSVTSLASLTKRRNQSVADACAQEIDGSELMTLSTMQAAAAMSSADVWCEDMTGELDFNNDKYLHGRIKSLRERSLLPGFLYKKRH